jgi:hypothetical protein
MHTAAKSFICTLLLAGIQSAAFAKTIKEVHGFEPHFVLPPGTDMVNIKTDFGAKGDGRTDDTAAFKKAIEGDDPRRIYIPAGTYLVKDSLVYGLTSKKKKRVALFGESASTSILKLADNSPGFNDPKKPKVFLHTRPPQQQGEQNMHQYVFHPTIEIGKGNSGAIALNYHSNNTGAIKDVIIRASDPQRSPGFIGLACMDWEVGPSSGRYITVDGFQTGVSLTKIGNYFTMEHITVKNCAIGVHAPSCSIRDLNTDNCGIAVQSTGNTIIIDSILKGKGAAAITKEGKGFLFARNIKTTGFSKAISTTSGTDIAEYVSEPVKSLWPPAQGMETSLNLPIENSPEMQYPQTAADWAVMPAKGDISDDLQRAIDSGKKQIYLVPGKPSITKTIILRNNVERIMGVGPTPVAFKTGDKPAFRLEAGKSTAVALELIYSDYASNAKIDFEQAAPRTFIIRHGGGFYETAPGGAGGRLFMENVVGGMICRKVTAWMRDMDTEEGGATARNITNDGGTVWILGQKTEDYATKITSVNGAFTELLGGTYRQNWDTKDLKGGGLSEQNLPPLFLVENSHVSLSYNSWGPAQAYEALVVEKRGGETRTLSRAQHTGAAGLFIGYSKRPAK